MSELATKGKQATAAPSTAGPTSAAPSPDDAAKRLEQQRIAEEQAAKQRRYAEEQRKAGKASSRFNTALKKAGLTTDIGEVPEAEDKELENSRKAGGAAVIGKNAEWSELVAEREGDDTGSGKVKTSVGTDGRNVQVRQEGLWDGPGAPGSASVGKDGISVGDIEIADGWAGGLNLGPGQQKVEFAAPTGLQFPPPNGLSLDFLDIKVPLGPGFGISVGAGVEGGLELGDVGLALEHRSAETGIEQLDRFAVTGSGKFSGAFSIKLEVAMWGGIPVIAAVRAGIRATAGAKADLEFEAGGQLDVTRTVPVWGETAKVTSKDGMIYVNVVGTGELAAALAAFVGYEFFTFKGDLYQLVIAKATLANFELGANFGVRYDDGKKKLFVEPVERDYASFDWLFGKLWKARKLDAAKAEATDSMADLAALEDLGSQADVKGYLEDLEKSGGVLEVANGELQLLLNEEKVLTGIIESDRTAIASLERDINGPLQDRNIAAKKSIFQFRDIKDLRKARKQKATLEKNIAKHEKQLTELAEKKREAQRRFIESLNPDTLNERVEAAREKANAVYFKNLITYSEERAAQTQEHEEDLEKLGKTIKEQEEKIRGLKARLETEASAGEFRSKLASAKADESEAAALVARLQAETDEKHQQVEASVPKKRTRFYQRKNAEEKAYSALKGELSKLQRRLGKAEKALAKATAERTKLADADPEKALNSQLVKAEAHRKLLQKRLVKRFEDAQKDRNEQLKLLNGIGVGKPRPKKEDPSTAFKQGPAKDRPVHPLAAMIKNRKAA